MTHTVAPDKMLAYQAAARARRETKRKRLATRQERAWRLARQAAEVLRREFGAGRVAAFGSVVHSEAFHQHSDVDVAAWGIPETSYLRAVASLLALDSGILVDLIRAEEATPALLECVEREGVSL